MTGGTLQADFWDRYDESPFYRLASEIGIMFGISDLRRSKRIPDEITFADRNGRPYELDEGWCDYQTVLKRAVDLYDEFRPPKSPPSGFHPSLGVALTEVYKWCIECDHHRSDPCFSGSEPLVQGLVENATVSKGVLRPLTETGTRIWDLLNGHMLAAKELRNETDPQLSEGAIRQTIKRIRESGRSIDNIRGSGYYRPDKPPRDTRESR